MGYLPKSTVKSEGMGQFRKFVVIHVAPRIGALPNYKKRHHQRGEEN